MANAIPTSKDAIMKVGARQYTLSSSEGLYAKARALVNAIEMAVTVVRLKKWYMVRKEGKQEDDVVHVMNTAKVRIRMIDLLSI
jgi:hypothetical protein